MFVHSFKKINFYANKIVKEEKELSISWFKPSVSLFLEDTSNIHHRQFETWGNPKLCVGMFVVLKPEIGQQ